MNIKVLWDNEGKTILCYRFSKGWTWNDLRAVFDEGYIMLDSVQHSVAVIMDFTEASMFAPSGAINQARHVSNNPRHPNIGVTTVVGSSFMSSIFKMIGRLAGNTTEKWDVVFVKNREEAYEIINAQQVKQDVS